MSAPTPLDALKALRRAIISLADQSEGVAGLHLNGDIAPWESLFPGGEYEDWLGKDLEDARLAIEAAQPEICKVCGLPNPNTDPFAPNVCPREDCPGLPGGEGGAEQ